jgi:hypothetical protein
MLAKNPVDRPADAASVSAGLRALAAELASSPSKAPVPVKEDKTLDGGPFDTLEGAQTVPSNGAPAAAFAETRTGIGPPRASDRAPVWNADAVESGRTLQIEAVTSGDEIATHTAAPVIHPQTPAPVSETPAPLQHAERRWGKVSLVATACVALGAGAAFSVRYTRDVAARATAQPVERKAASLGTRERAATPVLVAAPMPGASQAAEPVAPPIPALAHGARATPAAGASPAASGVAMSRSVPPLPPASLAPKPRRAKPKPAPGEPMPGSGL